MSKLKNRLMLIMAAGVAVAGLWIASDASQNDASAQLTMQKLGTLVVEAKTVDMSRLRWTLRGGRPHVRLEDGSLDVKADRITVDLNPNSKSNQDRFSKITAGGNVVVYAAMKTSKANVTASTATYSATARNIVFEGNVKAVIDDAQTSKPTVVNGDRIILYPDATDDEVSVRIEGEPAKIQVTPKESATSGKGNQ